MLLRVAWRNIGRNKKRSGIIIGAVTIGLAAGIFLMAFYNGMIEQRVRLAIQNEVSHLQLHHPDFRKDFEIRYFLPDGSLMQKQIQSLPDVTEAAGRIIIPGMIASASGSNGIIINAVQPQTENKVTGLKQKIRTGSYFNPEKRNTILIGEKLIKKLKLGIGNKTILTFQDSSGNMVSAAYRIAGIFKTSNTPYDESNVFISITDIDSLAGLQHQFNEIAVLLNSDKNLTQVQQKLNNLFPTTEVLNWQELAPEIALTVSVGEQMVLIFMGIILLALAFGIINTMLMAILERTREIGMLLALGMNRLKIFNMVLLETVLLVLTGCPFGIGIAMTAIGISNHTGLRFKKFTEVYSSFGYNDVIYPELAVRQFIAIMVLVVLTAILASLFPAWRALQLKPAEAMRK
ncbi:MAG TPA: FtsX-like permease family protein [Chitinophagaceae bacterium]|nr:FtsX-like permease family protein [Chitinophagaceae bacterium]